MRDIKSSSKSDNMKFQFSRFVVSMKQLVFQMFRVSLNEDHFVYDFINHNLLILNHLQKIHNIKTK